MTRLPLLLVVTSLMAVTQAAEPAPTPAPEPAPAPAEAGPRIVAEAFGRLSTALGEAIAKQGAAGALSVCSEQAPAIAADLGKAHGITLRRATEKPRNPKNAADPTERDILAGFAKALKDKQPLQSKTVTQADGRTTYFAPIVIPAPLCLQCHGTPGRDIAPATRQALQKLYPTDQATGYKTGDLRGVWSVTFPARP